MNTLKKLLAGGLLAAFAAQATAAADTVRIGYQNEPDPSHVAIVDGAYEKAIGDKIEWRKFNSGSSVIAALASNAIDIGYAGSSPLAAGVTRGAPIEAFLVAGLIGKAEGLVARNGSDVNEIKDLVGKKVATPFVSTSHYSLLFALKHAGVDPTKVNILNLQPPEIAAAFVRGDIDAAYVWDPVLTKAKENGKVLIDSAEVAKLGGPTFVAWITRKDYAAAHPEVLKAFTQVTLDTYGHFRKDPDDYKAGTANAKKIADFNGAKVEDIFDEVDGAYYPLADEQASQALLGKGTADAIAATAAFLKEQKKVDALLPSYSGTITAEFVKAVEPDAIRELCLKRIAPFGAITSGTLGARRVKSLDVRDVVVRYCDASNVGDVVALDRVSLTIEPGAFVVALGASGCGKTTLLNLMAGFLKPASGSVSFDGRTVDGPSSERGVVFQHGALMPWLNVIDNVAFGLETQTGSAKRSP